VNGSISYHICALCSLILIAGKCAGRWTMGATRVVAEADEPSGTAGGMLVRYAALTVMLSLRRPLALVSPRTVTWRTPSEQVREACGEPVVETPDNAVAART
jgi:hypothetical protein